MRKKLLPIIISSFLVLSGCSRNEKDAKNTELVTTCPDTAAAPVQTVPVTSKEAVTSKISATSAAPVTSKAPVTAKKPEKELRERPFENFPVTDGSTSTISLDAYICASYLGISYEEAEKTVIHTKTHQSFDNLISGDVEAIYTVPLSAEQKQKADEKKIELEKVPAAREGFVFVVNADNPVDSLTQDQIRKIYSGEITNWSEVGGNDAEIRAFQRNKDSGSYNYMTEFMGEYELCEPQEKNYEYTDMAGIMFSVGNYDNGIDSIGFSVYSFASDPKFENIKFIAVDSVMPSAETLNDGTYPVSSYSYFMYRADEPEDSCVRQLAEFIQSEEGQDAVERAGLIRTDGKKKGLFVSEADLYTRTGTGHQRPYNYTVPNYCYTNTSLEKIIDDQAYEMVSEFISSSESELNDMIGTIPEIDLPVGNKPYDADKFTVENEISCINQYCSVMVKLSYNKKLVAGRIGYFDLAEYKQLELSDLFYEGVNYIEYINNEIKNVMSQESEYASDYFAGLSDNCLLVDPCRFGVRVYFPYRNPYFDKHEKTLYMDDRGRKAGLSSPAHYGLPVDNYNVLTYEMADKTVIFEEYDVSDLYSDARRVNLQNDFYSRTFPISRGFAMVPVKSRILSDSQLRELQKTILECAERILTEETEDSDDVYLNYLFCFMDLNYITDERRFLLIPKGIAHPSDRSYYLDIDTLEFYSE